MISSIDRPERMTTTSQRVGLVTTFPPTRCGIARFSSSLISSLHSVAPDLEIDVVRLLAPGEKSSTHVGMEIDPNSPVGIRAAARRLDRSDVVVVQHEYGIFGDHDGQAVVDLVDAIHPPVITALHTVPAKPTVAQRRILEQLGQRSRLVVLSESALDTLSSGYDVPRDEILVVPHGTHWSAQPVSEGPRRSLITWGLLGPGKGLERSIRALSHLRDLSPKPIYRIVGRTHPAVLRTHGLSYRRALEDLVRELELDEMVEFVDRYLDDDELLKMVASSDVVVIPYDNEEQVSSGVVTDAIGAGRPVVATRFPHAMELVRKGAGISVPHNSEAMADAIRLLLDSEPAYLMAAATAAESSKALSWVEGARTYAGLIEDLGRHRATA
jgi:glycosyltransferase involved in cell wall biosynthesis